MEIYLDNCATTSCYDEVIDEMVEVLKNSNYNPSAAYRGGIQSEKILEKSRKIIASVINTNVNEVYFTSGGSESNNFAIKGIAFANQNRGKKIISSDLEHDSVLETCKILGNDFVIENIPYNSDGIINLEKFSNMITKDTILVSLMHVNNELGIVNPIDRIGEIIKNKNKLTFFHVDAVQSFLKFKIDLKERHKNVDTLSASAHKVHGPKGVGLMYIRENTKILPLISGGGQERGYRSGTENVAGIAGFAKAVDLQKDAYLDEYAEIGRKKEYIKEKIENSIKDVVVNSAVKGANHILNISFLGVGSEILLHSLEMDNILVSTASACSSKKRKSRVLSNLGLSDERLDTSIRFSFSNKTSYEELDYTVEKLIKNIKMIRKTTRYKIRG